MIQSHAESMKKILGALSPYLSELDFYITSFWSGGFTKVTAMNQKDKNLGKSIFVHFDMTFLTTLTGIFDFANLIFQT